MAYLSSLTSKIAWLCHCQIDEATQTIRVGMLFRATNDPEAIVTDPDPDLINPTQYRVKLPDSVEPQQYNVTLPYEVIRTDDSQ